MDTLRLYGSRSEAERIMTRPFALVYVFGTNLFSGNPLGVIADAESLESDEMQRIARWLNLSEIAFLLSPTCPCAGMANDWPSRPLL